METKIINFTPTLAKTTLSFNTNNRHLSQNLIDKYAGDMSRGNWQPQNGETLKFADNGKLLDGQHRLHAIVQSGVSLKLLVVSGLDENTFLTIDTGKSRTAGDVVSIYGFQNANTIAAGATKILIMMQGKGPVQTHNELRPSRKDILEFVQENDKLLQESLAAVRISGAGLIMSQSMSIALHFLFANTSALPDSKPKADSYFYQLRTGEYDQSMPVKKNAIYLFRERVLLARNARQTINAYTLAGYAIKAWNAWATGKQIALLRLLGSEDFPEII